MLDSAFRQFCTATSSHLYDLKLSDMQVASGVSGLSEIFTRGRKSLSTNYFADPLHRAGYLALFMPINAYKIMHCLSAILVPKNDALRILDVGAGPGTASLAASAYFAETSPHLKLNICALEQNRAIADEACALFARIKNKYHSFEIKTEVATDKSIRSSFDGANIDIAIAANLLNEIQSHHEKLSICFAILDSLSPSGVMIIVDPALRTTARPLMRLRDDLIKSGAEILSPCLNQSSCPMLAANERDWCHFYIEWKRPALICRLDEITGMHHENLKMSYLIIRRKNDEAAPENKENLWRAVSSPLKSKGKVEIVMCGSNGELVKFIRQNKNASESNFSFGEIKRGDIVKIKSRNKIEKEACVEIVRQFC